MIRSWEELKQPPTAAWRLYSAPGESCKTCHVDSLWSVPYGTCFMDALRTHRLMRAGFSPPAEERNRREEIWWWKVCQGFEMYTALRRPLSLTEAEVCVRKEKDRIRGKLMRRAYLELFDVPWGDKATRTRAKCPGGGGVSASQTWWSGKVKYVSDTGSAKVIFLRWQCWISVSLRMQRLFLNL